MPKISRMRGQIILAATDATELFDIESGGKQDGVETLKEFNTIFECEFEPLVHDWAFRGISFSVGEDAPSLSKLIWWENVYSLASSMGEFQKKVDVLTHVIHQMNCR